MPSWAFAQPVGSSEQLKIPSPGATVLEALSVVPSPPPLPPPVLLMMLPSVDVVARAAALG